MILTLLGVVTGGLVFDRYLTVVQLGRNAASMFSRGADFSTTDNKNLLLLGAQGLNINLNGGDGVIYLSRLQLAPPGTVNDGRLVIAERHVIGDSSYAASTVGQPDGAIWPDPDKPSPTGDVKDPNDETSARASSKVPSALQTLPLGESMYVVEIFHSAQNIRFGDIWGADPRLQSIIYY
ncbi:MAG: hypothetical protein MI861_07415 [Pirellulales bacterium]|nr:hypothetical protein [Pirellulales bacterium]